ncbi:MAG: hypothetical protein ACRDPF_08725 [Streptosporangiaceae bacterium]
MFTKTTCDELQGKKHSRTGIRRALAALALAGTLGAIALATPLAASAGTITLGPNGIAETSILREYPANGQAYTSGALAGCEIWVGDHWRSDGLAAGQGEVWCNKAHTFAIKVYLDYRTSPSGALYTWTSATWSWSAGAGVWGGTYTNGACSTTVAKTLYWTTYVEVSVDGSPWQGWFTSATDSGYPLYHC